MRIPILAGLLLLVGCGQLGEVLDRVTLSEAELAEASDNYAGALAAFKELEAFAVQVSEGDVDLDGAEFTAPTEENGWIGGIAFLSDQFPGGSGELDLTFSVDGPNGPMDPFLVDTTTDPVVTTSIRVLFTGQSSAGADLNLDAEFTIKADRTDPAREVITVNGRFRIDHNGYVADLTATELVLAFDVASGAIQSGSGDIRGTMEIPGYTFDADVAITANNDRLHVLVEVLNQTIEDSETTLEALFGASGEPNP